MNRELIIRYEQALLETFPPLQLENLGGLTLGAAQAVTGRANSACSLGESIGDPSELMDDVESWYCSRGLVPTVRVSPLTPQALIDELASRGYLGGDDHLAATRAMRLVDLDPHPVAPIERLEIHSEPPPDWGVLSERTPEDEAIIAAMLERVAGSCGWATARDEGGSPVAVGRAVVAGDIVCIQSMATKPAHQRRGLASALLGTLHRWAVDRGATHAFLHVLATNPAIELYERFGYRPLYDYHYRVAQDLGDAPR